MLFLPYAARPLRTASSFLGRAASAIRYFRSAIRHTRNTWVTVVGISWPQNPSTRMCSADSISERDCFSQARDVSFSRVNRLNTDVLVEKTLAAARTCSVSQIVLAGGVAANQRLRDLMSSRGRKENFSVFLPPIEYCTDNAAMIAVAGYHLFKNRKQLTSTIDMDVYSRSRMI